VCLVGQFKQVCYLVFFDLFRLKVIVLVWHQPANLIVAALNLQIVEVHVKPLMYLLVSDSDYPPPEHLLAILVQLDAKFVHDRARGLAVEGPSVVVVYLHFTLAFEFTTVHLRKLLGLLTPIAKFSV
jgi:hypothetical protein